MTVTRPCLRALATRLGVVDAYWDIAGGRNETSDATREALCAAMGHDASSETRAEKALEALEFERSSALVEPVHVWRQHARLTPPLLLRHPGSRGAFAIRIELEQEDGAVGALDRELPGSPAGAVFRLPLPGDPPVGIHRIRIASDGGCAEHRDRDP